MPKRKDATTPAGQAAERSTTPDTTTERRVVAFAEELGRIAGTVQARADGWLDHQVLNGQLTRIREGATDLLNHLANKRSPASSAAAPAEKQTTSRAPGQRAAETPAGRATVARGRSGGKVDAPGKTHRKPPTGGHGIKHSDEMVSKLKASQTMRRGRRRG